jgi:hypothetical protein
LAYCCEKRGRRDRFGRRAQADRPRDPRAEPCLSGRFGGLQLAVANGQFGEGHPVVTGDGAPRGKPLLTEDEVLKPTAESHASRFAGHCFLQWSELKHPGVRKPAKARASSQKCGSRMPSFAAIDAAWRSKFSFFLNFDPETSE